MKHLGRYQLRVRRLLVLPVIIAFSWWLAVPRPSRRKSSSKSNSVGTQWRRGAVRRLRILKIPAFRETWAGWKRSSPRHRRGRSAQSRFKKSGAFAAAAGARPMIAPWYGVEVGGVATLAAACARSARALISNGEPPRTKTRRETCFPKFLVPLAPDPSPLLMGEGARNRSAAATAPVVGLLTGHGAWSLAAWPGLSMRYTARREIGLDLPTPRRIDLAPKLVDRRPQAARSCATGHNVVDDDSGRPRAAPSRRLIRVSARLIWKPSSRTICLAAARSLCTASTLSPKRLRGSSA